MKGTPVSSDEPTPDQIPSRPSQPSRSAGTTPPIETERSRGRTGRILAGATGALMLTAGLGGVALARTSGDADSASTATTQTGSSHHRAGQASSDLDDLTLGDLSEELERLGLEVRVVPERDDRTEPASTVDGAEGAVGSAEETVETEVDPFAGMSDAEIDALSDEEFFDLLEQAGIDPDWGEIAGSEGFDDDGGHDEHDEHDDHQHGADEAPLAEGGVDGDQLDTTGLSPEVAEQALQVWNRFVELIPADQRQMISGFELLGEDYQGAHVYPEDDDPTRWVLGVGLGLGEDLDYVLIHEFAHLLTLQAEEVPPSTDDGSCPTYHTGEGCALRGSTMAEFVKQFWTPEMRATVEELYESEDQGALEAFYQQRRDQFVTDYAATNPAEDLAETFAHFVTEDRPTGDSIADQKVQLLWADPDLVELRAEIRSALD